MSSALVSQLLDGATLREKAAAPLPLAQVLDIAAQIAAGLAGARSMGKARSQVQRWLRRFSLDPAAFRR